MLKTSQKQKLATLVQQKLAERPDVRPLPVAVTQLLAACQNPCSTAITFEKIVECDPALAVRVLRLANSSLYGLAQKVTSVRHATVVLGIRQLKNLALSVAGARLFLDNAAMSGPRHTLWSHCLGCATVAHGIARLVPSVSSDDAFLSGILHDVGRLLLYDVGPEECLCLAALYDGKELLQEEELVFGVTHEQIGLKSAHAWGLPEEIKAAIGFHHHPDRSPVHFEHAAVIHLADGLARAWGVGTETSQTWYPVGNIIQRLGLDEAVFPQLQREAQQNFYETTQAWIE